MKINSIAMPLQSIPTAIQFILYLHISNPKSIQKRPAVLLLLRIACLFNPKIQTQTCKDGWVYLQPSYLISSHIYLPSPIPIHKIVLHLCLTSKIASTLLLSRMIMLPQISLLKPILFHPAHPRTPRINLYTRQ
jgi:hypothetical protein